MSLSHSVFVHSFSKYSVVFNWCKQTICWLMCHFSLSLLHMTTCDHRKKLPNMTRYVRRSTPAPKMRRFYILDTGSTPPGQVIFSVICRVMVSLMLYTQCQICIKTHALMALCKAAAPLDCWLFPWIFSLSAWAKLSVSLYRFLHSRGRAEEHEHCPHRSGWRDPAAHWPDSQLSASGRF